MPRPTNKSRALRELDKLICDAIAVRYALEDVHRQWTNIHREALSVASDTYQEIHKVRNRLEQRDRINGTLEASK